MFTAKTISQICLGLLGAVSVHGDCWITPDFNGLVNIPDGTESIPERAFRLCDTLKAVNIPASVQNVGSYSFSYNDNLETVIFEEGSLLKVIGDRVFSNCDKLKMITLPANLEEIGVATFMHSNLQEVIFEEGSHLQVIGSQAFRYCKELKVVTLPPALKKIEARAFSYSGLERVIFEEGSDLETIGDGAFYLSELESINIPLGVETGLDAFKLTGCPEDIFTAGATIVDCRVTAETERGTRQQNCEFNTGGDGRSAR